MHALEQDLLMHANEQDMVLHVFKRWLPTRGSVPQHAADELILADAPPSAAAKRRAAKASAAQS